MSWKVKAIFNRVRYEVKSAMLELRIKRAWLRMAKDQKELDRIKRQSNL